MSFAKARFCYGQIELLTPRRKITLFRSGNPLREKGESGGEKPQVLPPQGDFMSGVNYALNADSTTLTLNGTAITDFIAGDFITLAPVNALTSRVRGSNGATVIKKRVDGNEYDLTVNVLKYSDSDIYLNSLMNGDSPKVINGSMKENYKKNGVNFVNSWVIENGSITTQPTDTQNNQDGNATMAYVIQCQATRI
ncbi:MAG: hypothetical protein LBH05_01580 [Deferribacteraceae bacterium]|jgi:hypothetical protein|nr:hypothetical protein [Deferribacteraceae bacterium]